MISQSYFQNRANDVGQHGDDLTEKTLEELRKIANRLTQDPTYDFQSRWNEFTGKRNELFEQRALESLTIILALGYLKGITTVDSDLKKVLTNIRPADNPLAPTLFQSGIGEASDKAKEILKDYPKHWNAFGAMEATARENIENTLLPIFRSQQDMIRDIQVLSLTSEFRDAETATRVTLAQKLMDDYAKQGITAVTYSNGAKMPIDNYSRMVARRALQQSANQASMNRIAERGYDLVRVNQYAGASTLCAPWQGGVYSLSGQSDKYPSLSSATFDGNTGLFHPHCGHSQSVYIPGVSEPLGKLSSDPYGESILNEMGEAKGNRFIYEQRQRQRAIERKIREWKYRKASALDVDERRRAQRYVNKWQSNMRSHLDEHPFLRRRRDSEQI